jgi:hypothetical protein
MSQKIYDENGKLDVEKMLANGWEYRDFPWVHENLFCELVKLLDEDDLIIMAKTEITENQQTGSFKRIRGQFLLSDEGSQKLRDWVDTNTALITMQTSDLSNANNIIAI